jgi:GNAT superfamily N-acetyltransferase
MSSSLHAANPMPEIKIAALRASPQISAALSEILIEAVASGGSVSFMHPLAQQTADSFWRDSLAAADRGERIVLGAFDGDSLVGTVTLLLSLPPNQPHRAEIAKMMTRISHRGRGVAKALMEAAERLAVEHGTHAAGARHRRRRRGFRALRRFGIPIERYHSGLRAQTARRADRHHDLLEAPPSVAARLGAAGRDRQKVGRLQASASDQRAVDVGDRHQFLSV